MAIEEEPEVGIPEWVVTFGDMMSLLLTFFIMLVSMSEIKEEEKFQAMMESMRRQFGHDTSIMSLIAGDMRPRNSRMTKLTSMGRAKRAHTMKGGQKVKAPVGDHSRVRIVRPGDQTTAGGVIYFSEENAELTEEAKRQLKIVAKKIRGKPQKIGIRGHTSRKPPPRQSQYKDNWELAFTRCRRTMDYLVVLDIDPQRIRLEPAGENEPVHTGTDPKERAKNSRVEIVMIDERVSDLEGSPQQSTK